ncbi:unnamed protein product [Brassica napus]|uniref:3-deoxy-8-phosphooctulonate synthase n=1 Tax=Brassica napus TaxID=3708 RepID=A0A816QJ60_BRANA|nr:unnamed protein product [Brassica napus]
MAATSPLYNQLKDAEPFFLLAGPNVIESEEHILRMAKHIKHIATKVGLPLVFKSSFDKANRTSSKSFRGPGMAEGLKILEKVKVAYDLPIVTDVHEAYQCEEVGKVADIIQIPAFLYLLVAAAQTGKIINIKKGQFCAPSVMENSAEKIRLAGNPNVMVCERGTMFGYNDLIVDPRNFEWMREANCPVVADITHALQQPAGKKLEGGGVASGGLRELIPCIARTAVAVGVDGIFMEVHDDPLSAPVDGPTQWPLRHLEELLEELIAIANSIQEDEYEEPNMNVGLGLAVTKSKTEMAGPRVKEAGHVFRSPPSRPSRPDLTVTASRAIPPKPSFHRSSYYWRASIESSSRSHPEPPKHSPHKVETHKPSLFIHALSSLRRASSINSRSPPTDQSREPQEP